MLSQSKKKYEERLNKAIHDHRFGETYRDAAQKHGVSYSTLFRRVNTPFLKRGRRCALQPQEEEVIVNFLLRYARRGIPLNFRHLQEAITMVVDRMPPLEGYDFHLMKVVQVAPFCESFV